MALPSWATERGPNRSGMPIIDVDTHAAYPEILAAYQAHYADEARIPGEWMTKDGDLRAEYRDMIAELNAEAPSAYWLEVVYQTAKLDVCVACGGWRTENRFHDADRRYSQASAPEGRDAGLAAGGPSGAREARAHYKRLRGYFPG